MTDMTPRLSSGEPNPFPNQNGGCTHCDGEDAHESHCAFAIPHKNVLHYNNNDTGVTIQEVGGDEPKFLLFWTDYVANDWTEEFPLLSIALARFATLIHCYENGWNTNFTHPSTTFVVTASEFFEKEAS